jgi:hypothetical protein
MLTIIHLSALGVVTVFVATLGVGLLECCMDPGAHLCCSPNLLYASRLSASVFQRRVQWHPEAYLR